VKNDVTLIDADAEAHAANFFYISIALRHSSLDRYRALSCVHDATKFCEDPITGGVNDAAAVLFDHGEYDGLMFFEVANGAVLVSPHQRTVSSDVGHKNCRQPAENLLFLCVRHLQVSRRNVEQY